MLALVETDFPIFFRRLADVPAETGAELSDEQLLAPLADAYYAPETLAGAARVSTLAWLRRYVARVREDGTRDADRRARMNAVNPIYLLRNYIAQEAIDAAEAGDTGAVPALLDVLRRPYDERPGLERFAAKRPDWARRRPGCSMLSCSS